MKRPMAKPHKDSITLDCGPAATERAFSLLGRNKGVGIDGIPAEVLQAGGAPAAILYSSVNQKVVDTYQWPTKLTGGLLPNIYKQKGDPRNCDDHRGILLADHAGKGLTGIIKDALDPALNQNLPADQYGGVSERGTDFATHLVVSATAVAQLLNLSVFVLFVDLTKAFDRIVRQLVMGWGDIPPTERRSYLESLGVSHSAAEWIVEYIDDNGPIWKQWHTNHTACEMARTLHEQAWFSVKDSEQPILSFTGGRQGCKLGSSVFNSAYTPALDMLRWRMKKHDIIFRTPAPREAFWTTDDDTTQPDREIVDAAFVDDESVMLLSRSPKALSLAIDILLEIIYDTFSGFHLDINWNRGKSEAVVALLASTRSKYERNGGRKIVPLGFIFLGLTRLSASLTPTNISVRTSPRMARPAEISRIECSPQWPLTAPSLLRFSGLSSSTKITKWRFCEASSCRGSRSTYTFAFSLNQTSRSSPLCI